MDPKTFTKKTSGLFALVGLLLVPPVYGQVVPIKAHNYPVPASGCVKFVAPEPTGKDSNLGTQASPWTLSRALAEAADGCVVVLRGGEYRQLNKEKITNSITLQPFGDENAWIKGSTVLSTWTQTTNGAGGTVWRYDNWTTEFPESDIDVRNLDSLFLMSDNRDMLFVNDISLKQVASLAEVTAGKFFVNYATDKIFIGTSPVNKKVESTRYETPFLDKNPSTGSQFFHADHITIKGIGFSHFADGVELNSLRGLQLLDNTFAWNGVTGIEILAPTSVIRGNTMAYNGQQGLGGHNLKNSLVEYNHAYENNIENFKNTWSAAGMKIIRTPYVKVRHNTIERTRNKATGLWFDISCYDFEAVNNTIKDNEGFGVFAELSNEPIIAGNLFVNNRNFAITISDTDSSEVWNNTIIGKGIFIKDSDRLAGPEYPDEITWITKNNIIKNNIISTTDQLWLEYKADADFQVKASNYNGFYRGAATNTDVIIKWNNTGEYTTLAAFRAAVSGYEVNSKAFYNQDSHPYFISSTNYRLKPGSAAIGAGQALPAHVAAALGWPAGVVVDMGAFQNQAIIAGADTYAAKATLTTNYGSDAEFQVKLGTDPGIKEAFLKFDIANVAGDITNARIRIYGKLVADGAAVQVQAFACATTGWVESTLNWNNKPASAGSVLSSNTVSSGTVSQWFEFDVSNYLKTQQANGAATVSFVLKGATSSTVHATFNSSEATSNKPELIVDYTADPGSTTSAKLAKAETIREATTPEAAVRLYPNPAREQLHIALAAGAAEPVAITVTNAVAKPVISLQKVLTSGPQAVTLDVSSLSPGLYFVTIRKGTERITRKVLVTR